MGILLALFSGCHEQPPAIVPVGDGATPAPSSAAAIAAFCGDCHVFPPPSSFPVERWRKEVEQGFAIYRQSGRSDLVPTDVDATVAWFESHAPQGYQFESNERDELSERRSGKDGLFTRVSVPQTDSAPFRSITHIRPAGSGDLLMTGLSSGKVVKLSLSGDGFQEELIARVADPVHVEPADLDGDGNGDYVIADLGSLNPNDQPFGTLWWARKMDKRWRAVPLQMNYARLCDARPLDFDLDGDQDLVVAEFGFRFEGSIRLLTNTGTSDGVPSFETQVIDPRNGAIHIPIVDINADGKPDFLALVSQEHESIEAYVNLGNGKFQKNRIHSAPDPAYACSGIEPVDLDGDGDLDVLLTNGDTFDDHTAKPFHSVQWLENTGGYPFKHHHLTNMPGVYRAVAGDIDLDGDLDIAAVSLISRGGKQKRVPEDTSSFDGIIWLEQVEPGQFARHRVVSGECNFASCNLVDVDQDGDLDLAVGHFAQQRQGDFPLTYFRNGSVE